MSRIREQKGIIKTTSCSRFSKRNLNSKTEKISNVLRPLRGNCVIIASLFFFFLDGLQIFSYSHKNNPTFDEYQRIKTFHILGQGA